MNFSYVFLILSITFIASEAGKIHSDELTFIDELNRNFTINFPTSSCGRIISGKAVEVGQKPFQVALFHKETFICGGSLVSQKHVITAAHCTFGKQAEDLKIRYGANQYDSGILNQVERLENHPGYESEYNMNDIAMLRLCNPVPITNFARVISQSQELEESPKLAFNRSFLNFPMSAPVQNSQVDGNAQNSQISHGIVQSSRPPVQESRKRRPVPKSRNSGTVEVSGWGRIGPYLQTSKQLLVTKLTLVGLNECTERWKKVPKVRITQSVLCARHKDEDGHNSACRGDSGGPLTQQINGVETLVGVVSIGASNCDAAQLPNVFTSVFHYRDWIAANLN